MLGGGWAHLGSGRRSIQVRLRTVTHPAVGANHLDRLLAGGCAIGLRLGSLPPWLWGDRLLNASDRDGPAFGSSSHFGGASLASAYNCSSSACSFTSCRETG